MVSTASRFAVLKVEDDEEVKAARRAAQAMKNEQNALTKVQKAALEKQKVAAAKKAARKQQQKQEKKEVAIFIIVILSDMLYKKISDLVGSFGIWCSETQKVKCFIKKAISISINWCKRFTRVGKKGWRIC